ncbi:42692_t:CDS:1 [Gigaspora margarita]|uniref:42692_t:CDS:1 n=1 Tax=Gigaspora margarita TaxID=4874 RepID=A0ABN7VZH7_GIGMA|nr:42692_t:CDS:1 [Gigaspora margarita]
MELILNNISYSNTINTKALNIFDPIIKNTLPSNYKYFIDDFEQFPSHNFLGAYKTPFKTNYRINIHTIEVSKEWFQKFMDLHKVTMRETRGRTIKGMHYILSKRFHCIHSHVVKQKQGKKNNNESYVENTQIQDINSPVENT